MIRSSYAYLSRASQVSRDEVEEPVQLKRVTLAPRVSRPLLSMGFLNSSSHYSFALHGTFLKLIRVSQTPSVADYMVKANVEARARVGRERAKGKVMLAK